MIATRALVLAALCLWASGASGQETLPMPVPADEAAPPVAADPPLVFYDYMEPVDSTRFVAEVDYVVYWLKPVCLKPATLSVGDPNSAQPGVLGQPGSQLAQGDHKFEFKGANGIRPYLAAWFNDDVGAEFEGFVLEKVAANQDYATTAGGPATYIVFQNPDNTQGALPFSIPGVVDGTSTAVGTSRLWGLESNLAVRWPGAAAGGMLHATLLGGWRYLHLDDRVVVTNRQSLVADPSVLAMGEANFSTRNQFIGGQLGSRFGITWERLNFDITTKLAIGSAFLNSSVHGGPLLVGNSVLPPLVPGPVLTLPSNVATRESSRVAIVPEVNLRLRYQVGNRAYVTLAYNLLYWNKVLCPGDQMDPHANITQLPFRGPVTGPRVPAPQFVFTDAFAQGLQAGFGLSF